MSMCFAAMADSNFGQAAGNWGRKTGKRQLPCYGGGRP